MHDAIHRPRVLVVDDDDAMRETMMALLEDQFEVVGAADGFAALEAYEQHGADVVLTDYMMPRLDGLSLLRSLSRHGAPFGGVLVTGMKDYFAQTKADDDTLDGVLVSVLLKPYRPEHLIETVGRAAAFAAMRQAVKSARAAATRLSAAE